MGIKRENLEQAIYKYTFKLIKSIVFICISIYGFNVSSNTYFHGEQVRDISYGGDAYTGIQNAAATAARNIDELGDFMAEAMSSFFIIGSLILIAIGIIGVIEAAVNIKRLNNSKYELSTTEREDKELE